MQAKPPTPRKSRAYFFTRKLGIKTGLSGDLVKYNGQHGRLAVDMSGMLVFSTRRRDTNGKIVWLGFALSPDKWGKIKIIHNQPIRNRQ